MYFESNGCDYMLFVDKSKEETERPQAVTRESGLRDAVDNHREVTPHPGLRDVAGFYEDDQPSGSGHGASAR